MDNYSQKRCEPIGEVNFGKVQWYKPQNKATMAGSVISYIDGSEARFDERTLVICDRKTALWEGDAIVYRTTGDQYKSAPCANAQIWPRHRQIPRKWRRNTLNRINQCCERL